MSGHRPDGALPPYYSGPKPEHCECGAELQYDGDYENQYWSAVDGDPSEPCPVHDAPYDPDCMYCVTGVDHVHPVLREFSFTLNATFAAATQQDAWDMFVEWLTVPMHVEDGTQVVEFPQV